MPNPPDPRGRRLEPDARREQLLSCAVRLFGERPYPEVSTTDIAREAGIARGLLNHYFGTKRDLYLEVVRRMVLVPADLETPTITGSLRKRVSTGVDFFLESVEGYRDTFLAVTGAGGIGDDPDVEAILALADDDAARRVLALVGLNSDDARQRAAVRAYGGLAKATVSEWRREQLSRTQAHLLLSTALLAIVRDVLPHLETT